MRVFRWVMLASVTTVMLFLVRVSGRLLVLQQPPTQAEVTVVLAGDLDLNDRRYWKGIEPLESGYGQKLFVDAVDTTRIFGRNYAFSNCLGPLAEVNFGPPPV